MTPPRPNEQASRRIQLPRSSGRQARGYAHCKVLTGLSQKPMGMGWEGKLYQPGQVVERADLPANLVCLECAGPQGKGARGQQRPFLWILWRWENEEWELLAQSLAVSWEWGIDLRPAAVRALYPDRQLVDLLRVGRDIAEGILQVIDQRLELEHEDLRRSTCGALYDRLAARMAS